jgi:hypothetical protein
MVKTKRTTKRIKLDDAEPTKGDAFDGLTLTEVRRRLPEFVRAYRTFRQVNEALQKSFNDEKATNGKLAEQLAAEQQASGARFVEIENLQRQLETANAENSRLLIANERLGIAAGRTPRETELADELRRLRQVVAESQGRAANREAVADMRTKELAEREKEIERLRNEFNARFVEQERAGTAEVQKLRAENVDVRRENDQLRAGVQKARAENVVRTTSRRVERYKVGDVLKVGGYDTAGQRKRLWVVEAQHLGGEGQESVYRLRALDVGAPTTIEIFVPCILLETNSEISRAV